MPYTRRQSFFLPVVPLILSSGLARAGALDPAAVTFQLPHWNRGDNHGSKTQNIF